MRLQRTSAFQFARWMVKYANPNRLAKDFFRHGNVAAPEFDVECIMITKSAHGSFLLAQKHFWDSTQGRLLILLLCRRFKLLLNLLDRFNRITQYAIVGFAPF